MRRPSIIIALLGLAACASVPSPPSAGPTAAIGRTAVVGGVQVRPIELLEDSRCPALVRCVWAGQVRLLVEVMGGDGLRQRRELILGQPQQIDRGTLTLAQVEPAKAVPGAIDPAAYRFTFSFMP